MNSQPWIEKYRPETFKDITHHDEILTNIANMIENKNLMNMIFVGNMGSGKSSTSRVISKKLYGNKDYLMTLKMNASDQRGINEIRDTIEKFASASFDHSQVRMIILDEADAMTIDAQLVLSQLIDKYKNKLIFCIICNYIRKIHQNIKSRCILFRFESLSPLSVKNNLKKISEKENIKISDNIISEIAMISNGDMRKAINILFTINFNENITIKKLYQYIKIPSKKISKKIMDIIIKKSPINEKYILLRDIISSNGYNLFQILQIILDYILQNQKYDILPSIAKLEMNLIDDFSETIQLIYLISLFNN